MEKFLVFGASPNRLRHSNKAVKSLIRHNKEVIPVGFRKGTISGIEILTGTPELSGVNTVLLYMGQSRLSEYYNYIINLKPNKVVFNPGTENPEFMSILEEKGVDIIEGCSLVMINSGDL